MLRGNPSDFLGGINPNDLKQFQQQFAPSPAGLYVPPGSGLGVVGGAPGTKMGVDPSASFDPSFLDTGLGTGEDFFSPFLSPDFPIDISLPLQLGDGVMQSQAPLMQVAQSQTAARRNPKLVGKRKLQTAAKARQQSQQQPQAPSLPQQTQQPKQGLTVGNSMGVAPTAQPSMTHASLSALAAQPLVGASSQTPCYVDSPPSQDQEFYGDEPNKRQKRLVKNRQAAQLFRKRQKQYIEDLENKVAEVTNKNIALIAKVDVLVTENQLIKDQLKYLRTFVVSALEQAFPPKQYAEMQQQLGDIGLTDSPKKEPVAASTPAPAPAPSSSSSSTTTTSTSS